MARNFRDEEAKEQQERNIFRCALLSISGILTNALDGIEGIFIHKALTHDSPTLYNIS